ncbi:hypothetical protein FOZ63_025530 [Perkinsus olseni]|uniref:Metalloendopeptidase n=2 Tax=Perkinsus olseni TaxID=32597 RepID=A0A7J6SP88_PEROL|nr:hypothetical protein FOZ63_025530 [Perkinsus olseni]
MALWAASPSRRRPLGRIKLGALNNNGIMECIAAREGELSSLLIFHIDRVNRGIGISTVRCGRQRYVHYPYQLHDFASGRPALLERVDDVNAAGLIVKSTPCPVEIGDPFMQRNPGPTWKVFCLLVNCAAALKGGEANLKLSSLDTLSAMELDGERRGNNLTRCTWWEQGKSPDLEEGLGFQFYVDQVNAGIGTRSVRCSGEEFNYNDYLPGMFQQRIPAFSEEHPGVTDPLMHDHFRGLFDASSDGWQGLEPVGKCRAALEGLRRKLARHTGSDEELFNALRIPRTMFATLRSVLWLWLVITTCEAATKLGGPGLKMAGQHLPNGLTLCTWREEKPRKALGYTFYVDHVNAGVGSRSAGCPGGGYRYYDYTASHFSDRQATTMDGSRYRRDPFMQARFHGLFDVRSKAWRSLTPTAKCLKALEGLRTRLALSTFAGNYELLDAISPMRLSPLVFLECFTPTITYPELPSTTRGWRRAAVEEQQHVLIGGDMLLPLSSNRTASRVADESDNAYTAVHISPAWSWSSWPGGIINYTFHPYLQPCARSAFYAGASVWEKYTCIRFQEQEYTPDTTRLLLVQSEGTSCFTTLGYHFDNIHTINLGEGCTSLGTVIHELGHAIGLPHVQNRPDRDAYVDILWGNIVQDKEKNFFRLDSVRSPWLSAVRGTVYDYESIMHYGECEFSVTSKDSPCDPTVLTLEPEWRHSIGQRQSLSEADIAIVNDIYACEATCADGILNQLEFDIDCGGQSCRKDCADPTDDGLAKIDAEVCGSTGGSSWWLWILAGVAGIITLVTICFLVDRAVRGGKSASEGDGLMYAEDYEDDEEEEYGIDEEGEEEEIYSSSSPFSDSLYGRDSPCDTGRADQRNMTFFSRRLEYSPNSMVQD